MRERVAIAILFACSLLVAGCGGGGGGSTPGVTPTSTPTQAPATTTASLNVGPGNSASAIFQPITEGAYASVGVPGATSGSASIMGTLSASAPSNAPALSSAGRLPRAVGGSPSGLLYVTLAATATVTFPTSPSFTFTLPSNITVPGGASTYVALYDPTNPTAGWQLLLGPVSPRGQTFTFTPASSSFTFAANQVYAFAFFSTAQPIIVATPSPSPSPTLPPTPTPSPQASSFVASSSTTITTSPLAIALPSAGPWGGTLTLSFAYFDSGTPLNYTLTNYPPTGVPALSTGRRALDLQLPALYVSLTTGYSLTNTAILSAPPSFAFTVAGQGFVVAGQSYYMALYDSSEPSIGWQYTFGGPESFVDTSIAINAESAMTFGAGNTYVFALYPSSNGALPSGGLGASPTPQPTATPTTSGPSPSPSPTSSGAGFGLTITVPSAPPITTLPPGPVTMSVGQQQFLLLSQAGYGGSFTAASLEPQTVTTSIQDYDGTYGVLVSAVATGNAEIQFASRNGGFGSVGVIVTGP